MSPFALACGTPQPSRNSQTDSTSPNQGPQSQMQDSLTSAPVAAATTADHRRQHLRQPVIPRNKFIVQLSFDDHDVPFFEQTATSEQDRETASATSKPEAESRKEPSEQVASSTSGDAASAEELRQLASARRQKSREDNMGLVEGILDETRRISWPTPGQALKDTFVVVGIVAISAIVLFGLNSALSEASRLLYGKLGR